MDVGKHERLVPLPQRAGDSITAVHNINLPNPAPVDVGKHERLVPNALPQRAGDSITAVHGWGRVFPLEAGPYVVPEDGVVTFAVDLGKGWARVVDFKPLPRGDF